MNPVNTLANIAAKKAAKMKPEQAGEGLMIGVDMFTGRIDSFLKDQGVKTKHPASALSLLVSQYTDEDKKRQEVRFDLMRITALENGISATYKHISQHKVAEIMGIPEMFEGLINKQFRRNILEAINVIAKEMFLPAAELQFHIEYTNEKMDDLKLCLRHNGRFIKEINPEKEIEQAVEKGEFNNGNSNK